MPVVYPEEFRQRAMQMVRDGTPAAQAAKHLGIAESALRRWLARDEVDAGRKGLTTDERKELAELRRKNRRLEMENEILKRAAAYFAAENVLPK